MIKIALPNKGRLYQDTISFLEKCGLGVVRNNERQYQSRLTGLFEDVGVVFQRALDIPKVVGLSQADLGITGLDIFCEMGQEARGCLTVFPDVVDEKERQIPWLPYGKCALVLAVPDSWVDITSISDLAELAIIRKKENRMLRVATEFPNLTRDYLFQKNVSYFEIVEVSGAVESAPRMAGADIVSDLMSSGVTLSENRLKLIDGGCILKSQACLIASSSLQKDSQKMALLKQIIDRIEAHLNAMRYYLVTANIIIEGKRESDLKRKLIEGLSPSQIELLGQEGPTISRVMKLTDNNTVWSISMQVKSEYIEEVISILKRKNGKNILVLSLNFIYDTPGKAFFRFNERQKIK